MNATFSRNELAAALLFASKDEDRYAITGLCIATRPGNEQPLVVATDGRRLAVIETVAEQAESVAVVESFTLRADWAKAFVALSKACGGKVAAWIRFSKPLGAQRMDVEFVGCGVTMNLDTEGVIVAAAYPDWQKVIPLKMKRAATVTEMALNSSSVGDFAKAAKFMGAEPTIQLNIIGKGDAVEVKLPGVPTFYGLLMQSKLDPETEYQPEFVTISKHFKSAPPKGEEDVEVEP